MKRLVLTIRVILASLIFICFSDSDASALLIDQSDSIQLKLPINPSLYQKQENFLEAQELVLTPQEALADGFSDWLR